MSSRLLPFALTLLAACAATPAPSAPFGPPDLVAMRQQVWDTELAFAATMAARDHDAFTAFLAYDAVFLTGGEPLRGKPAVATAWEPFFEGTDAPFAWEPDTVEVLASGGLALSTGPVTGPSGAPMGRFTSIWRLEPDGWQIVFDKGDGD